ncbi:hypothetical protein OK351_07895 [Glutamicibacter sp. MNS18]|uniref:hypothetical protein n=1 Tax=Glutamicibacter sp. MNS18 TaxID=2989817 RepID=UPI002235A889|nr:hypothetical protein [Glutamicibacter sp. MNS18]MCW4465422.1 hypothetical protein [Glutamicibacter sp. MNS18]
METTDWLLDSDPALRWQVMRDLLDAPANEVETERSRIAREGYGATLLAHQGQDGYWNGDEWGENGSRKSVLWTLASLRRLGVLPADPLVLEAVERVRSSVTWHLWDDLPYFHGEVEPCINGGVLAQNAYFGVLGDGATRLVQRLVDEQLPDGGWNCQAPHSAVSSFDSTLCVLEGLLEYQRSVTDPEPAVAAAREDGERYLLERSLFRRKSTGEIAVGRYLNFSFPPYWFYDILRALDYFRDAGGPADPRLHPALEELESRRGADGRWIAGITWPGEVYLELDAPHGEPSRWNTLRALRVLRWAESP